MEKNFHDLRLPNNLPWHISLLRIATQPHYGPFKALLLRNKLVPSWLIARCQKLVLSSALPLLNDKYPATIIHSLKQPFAVDFDRSRLDFWLLDDHSIRRGSIDLRFGASDVPYTGSAICQFQRSALPAHRRKPILVMRFVECGSVVCTNTSFPQPRPGALLRFITKSNQPKILAYNANGMVVLAPLLKYELDLRGTNNVEQGVELGKGLVANGESCLIDDSDFADTLEQAHG